MRRGQPATRYRQPGPAPSASHAAAAADTRAEDHQRAQSTLPAGLALHQRINLVLPSVMTIRYLYFPSNEAFWPLPAMIIGELDTNICHVPSYDYVHIGWVQCTFKYSDDSGSLHCIIMTEHNL